MKKPTIILAVLMLIIACGVSFFRINPPKELAHKKLNRIERKKMRTEYFFNKLKDPVTNSIPVNIRAKEMLFKEKMDANFSHMRSDNQMTHDWAEVGPADVGGRTRAIALDARNSDIVFAGGVSGGIWKSIDRGTTWTPKLSSGSFLGISSIAQDPNSQDVWYATTGEISDGASSSGKIAGFTSPFLGAGIYKSTDNGETWNLRSYAYSTDSENVVAQDQLEERISSRLTNPFILTSKVITHNFSGITEIFVATQYSGIWVSQDGGDSFKKFASDQINNEDPIYCDIVIDENDYITVWFGPTDSGNNGLYRSWDQGETFFDVSGDSYPSVADAARNVLAIAPSNTSIVYSFLWDGTSWDQGNHFYKYDFTVADNGGNNFNSIERSQNLPTYDRSIFGGSEDFSTQGGYDMTLAVHPEDENYVVLGYINLVRSTDGFATSITGDPAFSWIGGNENPYLNDEGRDFEGVQHADQHFMLFDPKAPNSLIVGHDGGLSLTTNITSNRIDWVSLNNDYNITQYYTVSAGFADGESYIIGGTQDNGTPLLDHSIFNNALINSVFDLSSGDGSYCYAGNEIIYSSAQNGFLSPYYIAEGTSSRSVYGYTDRDDLSKLFIHPFTVDPNDEGTIFYASNGDGILARNDAFDDAMSNGNLSGSVIDNGWQDFNIGEPVQITALKVSDQNPAHKLYFGGLVNNSPVLASFENANTSNNENAITYIDVSMVEAGSWLTDIAINPKNGQEIILVYSNYNITGLYYSDNGGSSFTAIEGNLANNDNEFNIGFSGPSIRAAEIAEDTNGNKKYFVGTSVGLFSTSSLNGANTNWTIETPMLDNIVIEDLFLRPIDGALVVGTHGRGAFIGLGETGPANGAPLLSDQTFTIDENSDINTTIGQLSASDPEQDELLFSIVSGNSTGVFSLNTTSGELTLASEIDYEDTNNYTLSIGASDGQTTTTAQITVIVQDVNEAPLVENAVVSVDEDAAIGTTIINVAATDPENDNLTYALTSGNSNSAFNINNSGEISIASLLNAQTTPNYTLVIEVSDGSLTAEGTVNIAVNSIDDALNTVESTTFEIFPNPTTNYLHFSGISVKSVTISNLAGQKLLVKGEVNKVDLSALKNNVYLVTIVDQNNVKHTKKIVKN
ncbi:MAG: cadherin domain-containing protein [Cyclobacteriaceae bacterium]